MRVTFEWKPHLRDDGQRYALFFSCVACLTWLGRGVGEGIGGGGDENAVRQDRRRRLKKNDSDVMFEFCGMVQFSIPTEYGSFTGSPYVWKVTARQKTKGKLVPSW